MVSLIFVRCLAATLRQRMLLGLAGALLSQQPAHAVEPAPVAAQHIVVYHDPDRYACWPTDAGCWSWGDEILVGFHKGYYLPHSPENDHAYDRARPMVIALARSLDGGESWTVEDHPELEAGKPIASPGGIDFTHPNLAIRVREGAFYVSRDRGRRWVGPYVMPHFDLGAPTSRTNYIAEGREGCFFFLSVKKPREDSEQRDGAFAARTVDGGRTFQFLGWMTGKPLATRNAMPATVRNSDGDFVSLLQRRFDLDLTAGFRDEVSWIDAYGSKDQGHTWRFLSRIAYPDTILHNGNPPSQVRLHDGRLVAVYGVRSPPFGIRARMSHNGGRDWGPEFSLRNDGRNWDLGYCQSFERSDGKIVTAYYYSTKELPIQHIVATIWTPPSP